MTATENDRIFLHDHVVEVEIGAFQLERGMRQRIRFNVDVDIRPHPAPLEDDVDRILSYDRITEAIAAALAAERLNLLETLAESIASRILAEPQAVRVVVRIEKLDRGPFSLGVEIVRRRGDAAVDAAPLRPLVVFMADDVPAGAICCLGLPDVPLLQTGDPQSQRRVNLLGIEQNAHAFAARHPDRIVVSSRTEIDWAVRQGRAMVWAPSKMVLDAVEPPISDEPVDLALWLAELLGAERLVIHGDVSLPAGNRVAVERG